VILRRRSSRDAIPNGSKVSRDSGAIHFRRHLHALSVEGGRGFQVIGQPHWAATIQSRTVVSQEPTEETLVTTARQTLVVVAIAVVAIAIARELTLPWFQAPAVFDSCTTSTLQRLASSSQGFAECVEKNAKLFLEKDYAESKDLAKTFLTLLSALLVASITFSEKIVDIHNAKRTPLAGMLICWLLLLLAIVLTGSGLASMALAAGYAAYYPATNYRALESHAVLLFVGGCFSFGVAMLALLVSGAVSLTDKRRAALAAAPPHGSRRTGDDGTLEGSESEGS